MTWHIGACRDNATIRETKPAVKAEQTHTQCWADPGRAAGGLLVLGRSSTARRRNNEVVACCFSGAIAKRLARLEGQRFLQSALPYLDDGLMHAGTR